MKPFCGALFSNSWQWKDCLWHKEDGKKYLYDFTTIKKVNLNSEKYWTCGHFLAQIFRPLNAENLPLIPISFTNLFNLHIL